MIMDFKLFCFKSCWPGQCLSKNFFIRLGSMPGDTNGYSSVRVSIRNNNFGRCTVTRNNIMLQVDLQRVLFVGIQYFWLSFMHIKAWISNGVKCLVDQLLHYYVLCTACWDFILQPINNIIFLERYFYSRNNCIKYCIQCIFAKVYYKPVIYAFCCRYAGFWTVINGELVYQKYSCTFKY